MRLALWVAGLLLVLDQLTKYVALTRLPPGASVDVVPGFLSLTLVMNPGLAFGMLSWVPPGWRWTVPVLSVAALLVLLRLAARMLPAGGRPTAGALGLVFGGAVGNLIDRARFGAVVDFVDVHWRGYHWPAFNLADSGISVGVAFLALAMVLGSPSHR
jgi:signal peptidase II